MLKILVDREIIAPSNTYIDKLFYEMEEAEKESNFVEEEILKAKLDLMDKYEKENSDTEET